jgi:5'-nucleotidase
VSSPRLLLVNDDGIGAIGLQKLRTAADSLSDDVWTVAPAAERSGASNSISLTQPIRARQLSEREFAVDGTPADCVALGLSALLDRPPDLVLSGVNRGPNLAGDIMYSGTCGAAREAALRGLPAAALSVASVPGKPDEWGGVEGYLPTLLGQLMAARVSTFLNINFPSLPASEIAGTQVTRAGSYPPDRFTAHPGEDPRGVPYWWLELRHPLDTGDPGTDVAAVGAGYISITPLRADMTDDAWLNDLARILSSGG